MSTVEASSSQATSPPDAARLKAIGNMLRIHSIVETTVAGNGPTAGEWVE